MRTGLNRNYDNVSNSVACRPNQWLTIYIVFYFKAQFHHALA